MEFAQLGWTELSVSRLGLGCEPLGGTDWGKFDLDSTTQAVSVAFELGINLFDTADIYGLGKSEERLSQALANARTRAVIVSKCGIRWEANGHERASTSRDGSAPYVAQAVENSLRRLRLETIPLYLVHWPDPNVPIGETIDALDRIRKAGKIRYIGVSNFSANQLREAHSVAPIAAAELPYSLRNREAEDLMFPLCQQLGIAVLAYGSLAQGMLTGKYNAATRFGSDDRRQRLAHFQQQMLATNLETVERLRQVSKHCGRSPAQVALRWVLDQPVVACAIVGAKSPKQVQENLGALGWTLKAHERAFLNAEVDSL